MGGGGKSYGRCPRCKRKGLALSGRRSWVTTHHGARVFTCRYCSFTETAGEHSARVAVEGYFADVEAHAASRLRAHAGQRVL